MKKLRMFFIAGGIVIILVMFRLIIDLFNLDILPEMNLIGCFIGGTLFIMAIIMTAVFADFKESEKLINDLVVSISNLHFYCHYIRTKDDTIIPAILLPIKTGGMLRE